MFPRPALARCLRRAGERQDAALASASTTAAKDITKHIAKHVVKSLALTTAAATLLNTGMSVLIIRRTLITIT